MFFCLYLPNFGPKYLKNYLAFLESYIPFKIAEIVFQVYQTEIKYRQKTCAIKAVFKVSTIN